jgi:hypothetical protein
MPGLDPGIHRVVALDCRVEPGNDKKGRAAQRVRGAANQFPLRG